MDYTQPLGAAANASYVNRNVQTGVAGSIVPAAAIENVQREIVYVITEAGLNPNTADNTQLHQAIEALIAASRTNRAGEVFLLPGTTPLAGSLELSGVLLNRLTYANLWAFAQTSGNIVSEATWSANNWGAFSTGDGATTFRIPYACGEFFRIWDHGRGVDSGRAIGSWQADQVVSHAHEQQGTSFGFTGSSPNQRISIGGGDSGIPTMSFGGNETRPRNIPMMACIRY